MPAALDDRPFIFHGNLDMAGLRKLRGKYYVRVFMPGGKEKLLPTKTGDRKRAEAFKRQVEER